MMSYPASDPSPEQMARDILAVGQDRYTTAPTLPAPVPDAFPESVFPSAVAEFVSEAAETAGVPLSYLGSAVLGVAAGIVGNRAELVLKHHHRERPILWLVLIGGPGSGKSPALSITRAPLDEIQRGYSAAYADELARWDELPKPDQKVTPRPVMRSVFTTNATIEAIGPMCQRSPGLVVMSDELISWVVTMSKYQSSGTARADWLSTWSGAALKSDRKTAASIYVPRPTVSVVGGIQPALLPQLRHETGLDDGSLDRMLPVWPTPRPRRWNEQDIPPLVTQRYVDRMLSLQAIGTDDEPLALRMDAAAKRTFVAWFDENNQTNRDGFSAKGDRHVARLALILHVLRHATGSDTAVNEGTVSDAITLFEFFRNEHNEMLRAIGAGWGGLPTDAAQRLVSRLVGFLQDAGDEGLTRTALHSRLRGNTSAADLDAALDTIRISGKARKEVTPTGHRPRETWYVAEGRNELTNYPALSGHPVPISSYRREFE